MNVHLKITRGQLGSWLFVNYVLVNGVFSFLAVSTASNLADMSEVAMSVIGACLTGVITFGIYKLLIKVS
jgi:hypothetical protein